MNDVLPPISLFTASFKQTERYIEISDNRVLPCYRDKRRGSSTNPVDRSNITSNNAIGHALPSNELERRNNLRTEMKVWIILNTLLLARVSLSLYAIKMSHSYNCCAKR